MSNVNRIQKAILELEGGAFQKLFDAYLYKKFSFDNIQTLGVQEGTNKPTKGVPDSFVMTEDGKYILINYGTVNSLPESKIKNDILSCLDGSKVKISKEKIKKIICGYSSTNIHVDKFQSIVEAAEGIEIQLVGIDTISHDLAHIYPHIAKDYLGISIDTNQFFDIEDFIKAYDSNGINAPIDTKFLFRESEAEEIYKSINNNKVTVLSGPSGIGKTRLALEVCRRQKSEDLKIFCIKSNGNLLFEDIKYYISDPGKYLIFMDDANTVSSFENVLNTILTPSENHEITVIMTVRDYAKERVIKSVSSYATPNIINIGPFTNDEVKDILRDNLGLTDGSYLKQVTTIAKGNIRLAFLAGMRFKNIGYQKISSAEDIFKVYYGRIIDESKLTKNDILMLFFISVAGPVKSDENQFYKDLLSQFGPQIPEKDTFEKLYNLEMIDWFKNEITRIEDQSFGNYIVYYVLIEKKWINVDSLIAIGFPQFKNKIIFVLNTLMNIFISEEIVKYIEDSIINAWHNSPEDQNKEYLYSFYPVYPDKSLSIIKNQIEQEKPVTFDLYGFDINSRKNFTDIPPKEIEILGGFKYCENFEDAVDLLMLYFTKRPDLIRDFYFIFGETLLYDQYSLLNQYYFESAVMDKLWTAAEGGENFNQSFLYIHVAERALKTEKSFTENGENIRTVNFVKVSLSHTKELETIRTNIWKNFAVLRKKEKYSVIINRIISEINYNGLSADDLKKCLKTDFDVIYENIIVKDPLDFNDALIIDKFRKKSEKLGILTDDRFMLPENNPAFHVYNILIGGSQTAWISEKYKEIVRETILKEIGSYSISDYQKFFDICSFLEKAVGSKHHFLINTGLSCIFEILETDKILFWEVIQIYFEKNSPFKINESLVIKYLYDCFGYEKTLKVISEKKFEKKDLWLSFIWDFLPQEKITEKIRADYNEFVQRNLLKEPPVIPKVTVLSRYFKGNLEVKNSIIAALLKHPTISATFLGFAFEEEDIDSIFDFFENDLSILCKIYFNALSYDNFIDYDGKLFIRILKEHGSIWDEYIDWLNNNGSSLIIEGYEKNIFEMVWNEEKWSEYVKHAFNKLIVDSPEFWIGNKGTELFAKSEDVFIQQRKKQWLLTNLGENIQDIEKCRRLIYLIVTVIPDWKLEFILEFLKYNKNVKDFERINLFPLGESWSGSEIPLILNKIDFLKTLKNNLTGVDFIEHKNSLEENIKWWEQYQKKVELREYLSNEDYA